MFIYDDNVHSRTYANDVHFQYASEDEREAVSAKAAREKKLVSQSTKKAMKNRAALPRTAGLRTLSELTTEMTKAGLDPSRIQERAEMLAKVAGAKRKRQREEEEAQMDVDEDADMGDEGEEEWMDVDGEEAPRLKKARTNSGAVVAKGARHPRSNRQLAGMRDEAVSSPSVVYNIPLADQSSVLSKHQKQSSCGISDRENATCKHALERAIALSRPKW